MDKIPLLKIVGSLISAGLMAGLGHLFLQFTLRRSAVQNDGLKGRIRLSLWPTLVFPALLFGFGAVLVQHSRSGGDPMIIWVGLALITVGLISLSFCLPVYDIRWDQNGIMGPSSWIPWPIGPFPIQIDFSDILTLDKDRHDYWYVEDSEGRRIRWNHYYVGFPALGDAIFKARPDLFN